MTDQDFVQRNTSDYFLTETNGNIVRLIDYHDGAIDYLLDDSVPPPVTWGL